MLKNDKKIDPMSEKASFFSRFRTKSGNIETNSKPSTPETLTRSSSTNLKRELQIEQLLQEPIIDLEKIRNMAWAGIPSQHRARIWRLFLDYEPVNTSLTEQTLILSLIHI